MKDPYVYEGTNILKNKFNIKDEKELDELESAYAGLAIVSLKRSDFKINSIHDVLKIHNKLFSKVYDWAGKPRTIDIFKRESILGDKSIDYVFASYIDTALDELNNEFKVIDWNKLNPKEKIDKICYFVSEFWHIHPFREGNTRTTAMMLYFLIRKAGLHINTDFLLKNGYYFRNALALSCLYSSSKPEYLLGIVKDSVTLKNIDENKYQTIEGIDVSKYAYQNHTVEKLKTIKKPKDWKKKEGLI